LGLGGAYVAVAKGIDALHWNPAGLSTIANNELTVLSLNGLLDSYCSQIACGLKVQEGGWGISILTLQAGDIKLNYYDKPSKSVKAQQDCLLVIGYGHRMKVQDATLGIGCNIKILKSILVEEYTAEAYAVDLGILYKITDHISFGTAISNIGTKLRYDEKGDSLPLTIRIGQAYKIPLVKENNSLIVWEIVREKGEDNIKTKLGCEYTPIERFTIRLGYKINYELDSLTAGIGFKFNGGTFQIDYGFGLMKELDNIHQISFKVYF
jgi:hypothetical protein